MTSIRDICLLCGDALKLLDKLPLKVDMVLCDMPYGITHAKWDKALDLAIVWEKLDKVVKDNGAIVLFGSDPFSTKLKMSNLKYYKYDWIWVKGFYTNHLNAYKQPLRQTENISVFYKKQCLYIPQRSFRGKHKRSSKDYIEYKEKVKSGALYRKMHTTAPLKTELTFPDNLLYFSRECNSNFPTEKSVHLLEYLIRTYTLENEIVLDFTMGSGSTGVACINTNRKFIGIEIDECTFNMAKRRIQSNIFKRGGIAG
jgi:DNA modification methylase